MAYNLNNIKLVIWDLDETFWKGILSEGPITPIPDNIALINTLTNHGIVNTICSKNDEEQTIQKLKELDINDLFVFKSINWSPKGQRISKLIQDMGLRPTNCLFIDDNIVNLKEAQYYENDLMIAGPEIIPEIINYFKNIPANDIKHKRLNNYKILEQKKIAKEASSDNLSFLFNSNTQVEIHHDCIVHIDRIQELITRTNQLNYTKVRSTLEETELLCNDTSVEKGYVTVKDKFGDYGIVGFYALKDGVLIHFLFSCRTIGQGVEQYVYAVLNYPILKVVGNVINDVTNAPAPEWINQGNNTLQNESKKSHAKVIFKGACDLKVMSEYLYTDQIIEEYTYTSSTRCNYIEHHNHSTNYLQWPFLSKEYKKELLDECIFNDEEMFNTSLYDNDVAIVFLSTMIEPNLGIYRRKCDGFLIAFGENKYPLTDPANWDKYINNELFTADNSFSREWLESFSAKYEFIGSLSPIQIIKNAEELLSKLPKTTMVCYILGSETEFENNVQENYIGRNLIYKEMNKLYRDLALRNDRVLLIDVNDFIQSQKDFTNNINHFQRHIYYRIAMKANEYIESYTGNKLSVKNKSYLYKHILIDKIGKTGFYQSSLWSILRIPYLRIKKLIKIARNK